MFSRLSISMCFVLSMILSHTTFAKEVTLNHNAMTLRADLSLADDKTLADGVILLLHGTLAHNQMEIIKTTAHLLQENGYNTLAVNLSYALDKRPSSMLDCGIEHRHKHEDAPKELAAWVEWLKQEGANNITVLGHSRGGNQVAWFAAEQDSDAIDKIITVAPATWNADESSKGYEARYKKPLNELMAEAKQLIDADKGDTLMQLPGFVYCEKAKASANAFLSYYVDDQRKDTPRLLTKIKKPMLIVIGSADSVVEDLPAKLADIEQDNIQVETIDGADHFFRDLYADELVETIIAFIDD